MLQSAEMSRSDTVSRRSLMARTLWESGSAKCASIDICAAALSAFSFADPAVINELRGRLACSRPTASEANVGEQEGEPRGEQGREVFPLEEGDERRSSRPPPRE